MCEREREGVCVLKQDENHSLQSPASFWVISWVKVDAGS